MIATNALLMFSVAGVALSPPASTADTGDQVINELKAQIAELRNEVGALRRGRDGTWMTEQRAEEIRGIVQDVLADADTRASLLAQGTTAGYDGKFFLASADGGFRLNFGGHMQVRYTYNRRDNSGGDDNLAGFNLRRLKFKPSGYIMAGERKIEFDMSIAADQDAHSDDDGFIVVEDATIATEIADGVMLTGGRFKQPFALQNLTSSSRQLAVERAMVHEVFAIDRSEGVMISYEGDQFRLRGAINDGARAEQTDFDQDNSDFAFTGRGELLVMGGWRQFRDPGIAWQGEDDALMFGGALHYEVGETGNTNDNDNFLVWTLDGSFESNGFGVLAAFYGYHTDNEFGDDYDDYGILLEAGYFIVPDKFQPFVRYEMLMGDDSRPEVVSGVDDEISILTAGINWYQARHNAKFTFDVQYAFDTLRENGAGVDDGAITSSSLGLRRDAAGEDGQIALRAQYQITF